MRHRYEPPQPGNPYRLTVDQHVHSAAAIKRFADQKGNVAVLRRGHANPFPARPGNAVFCAKRVWSQHLEISFRPIEDTFQMQCESILQTRTVRNHQAISDYLSLWLARAKLANQPPPDLKMRSRLPSFSDVFTTDQQEQLEASRIWFFRSDWTLPGRFFAHFVGMRAMGENRRRIRGVRWGVLSAAGTAQGIVCPDQPAQRCIPINRETILVADFSDQTIDDSFVDFINACVLQHAKEFIFGHPDDMAGLSPARLAPSIKAQR